MVKSTTLDSFQASLAEQVEQPAQYATFEDMHAAIRDGLTAENPLGEIVGRVRRMANEQGIEVGEIEIRDLADRIHASLQDAPEAAPTPNPLAALAQRMVRERPAGDGHVGDPFEGMALDVDPADAFGLVQANVTAWLEERDRWASPIEIKHQAERLMAEAQTVRPGPVKSATYTVAPDGSVGDYTPLEAERELPGMPAQTAVTGDVHTPLKVPSDSIFDDGSEFSMSSALMQRARTLIARHPDHLDHLDTDKITIHYLWKKQGGTSKKRATFGKCEKLSGLKKHFAEATYVIWLAADHCRAAGYRDRELEALLFHEMLHTGVAEPDENTGRGGGAITVPHELEVFRAEVEIYGLWASDLKSIAPAFQQLPLLAVASENDQGQYTCVRCEDQRTHVRRGLCRDCTNEAAAEWLEREYPPSDEDGKEEPLPSEGVLIHDDGTPFTAEEIAAQEAAELRDDPGPECLECGDDPDKQCASCDLDEDEDDDDVEAYDPSEDGPADDRPRQAFPGSAEG